MLIASPPLLFYERLNRVFSINGITVLVKRFLIIFLLFFFFLAFCMF
nr:MAG TPA: hypothetical protein [Caudoviricetes sp.]